MKVLMFGWEFPPFKSGGLGTACYDLTKGLSRQGQDVRYALNDDKLRSLGWEPKKIFDEEIASIVEYYKANFIW